MIDKVSAKPKGKSAIPFWELLKDAFPDVQCERKFPWLVIPRGEAAMASEADIRSVLIAHCQTTKAQQKPKKQACTPDMLADVLTMPKMPQLEFDFFVPGRNIAFEFDERQHFTAERAASLRRYGDRVRTHFDTGEWIRKCDAISANDPDPIHRDWQRAYRDAIRDIRAAEHGVRLFRIAYDAVPNAENLKALVGADL